VPNTFLGFPVPKAKIAEMIAGAAPPLEHATWHEPDGSDPLVLPADITPDQVVQWDGTKFKGTTPAVGGIGTCYEAAGLDFATWFESIDGYYKASSPANGYSLSSSLLSLFTQGGAADWASIYKDPSEFPTLPGWDKKAKFKTIVTFMANGDSLPKMDVLWGEPDTARHFGFIVRAGQLKASVGNGSVETLSAALEDWGAAGYYKTKILEADYKVTSVDFYVDGVKVATISTNLPTGTTHARRSPRLYIRANGSTNYHGFNLSFWRQWKEY